jgi:hypothetical protein
MAIQRTKVCICLVVGLICLIELIACLLLNDSIGLLAIDLIRFDSLIR